MHVFENAQGRPVLERMVLAIQSNKEYLSEIDGLIGDGDHGMNMNKGFTMFSKHIAGLQLTFTEGLRALGTLLFSQIGGSMGPIYGTLFCDMASCAETFEQIGAREFAAMLCAGLSGLYDVVDARPGDKTIVDTLYPAKDALEKAVQDGLDFPTALQRMKTAAKAGMESTKDLVAKYGRSSRLGERSRGVLDAGAVSCCILLSAIADGMLAVMEGDRDV